MFKKKSLDKEKFVIIFPLIGLLILSSCLKPKIVMVPIRPKAPQCNVSLEEHLDLKVSGKLKKPSPKEWFDSLDCLQMYRAIYHDEDGPEVGS